MESLKKASIFLHIVVVVAVVGVAVAVVDAAAAVDAAVGVASLAANSDVDIVVAENNKFS